MKFQTPTIFLVLVHAVSVLCQNNAPVWDTVAMDKIRETFTRQVSENTTEGKVLGTLLARDPEGQTVTYFIDSENTVKVDPNTGVITLGRSLDREKGDNKVDMIFYAQDPLVPGSNVRNIIEYPIKLDVQDVNDNAPTFQNLPYGASVFENLPGGTTIFSGVSIVDPDDGYNAEVFLSCAGTDIQSRLACATFNVSNLNQPSQGNYGAHIFTKGPLDYESQTSYILTLLAKDNGNPKLSSRVNILIKVIDQQDAPPEFLNTPINLYTNESVPVGTNIGMIQARDRDQGNPRQVRIVQLPGDSAVLFDLVSASTLNDSTHTYNVITASELDRETLRGQAKFRVQAIELENRVDTNVTTTVDVLVNIYDINDNGPTFDRPVYNISTAESVRQTNDTQIPGLTMTVKDPDDASNARFRVFVENQTFPGAFTVFPDEATSQGPFALAVQDTRFMDYETPSYRNQKVVVVAREKDTINLFSSTATVYVTLLDVNDNSPQFERSDYKFTIKENTGPMFLTRVTATDLDSGLNGKVTYSIDQETGNTDITKYFQMNNRTGDIQLLEPVDYEQNREFTIVISASDSGSTVRTTKVVLSVIVENVNDLPPRFLVDDYRTSVTETSFFLQPAITVQAIDTEEGSGNITYRIVSGNTLQNGTAFQVDPIYGVLNLTRRVNFDETPNRQGFFEIVIEASDNGSPPLNSTVSVRVNVLDENNHDPRFTQLVFNTKVSELADGGTQVIQVQAVDGDRGINGQLTYSLQGSLDDFEIDPSTGWITVSPRARLDYERPLYRLTVIATDSGTPRRRSSTAVVNVDIVDKNNKDPVFTESLYTATVSEVETMNSQVLQVSANDPDTSSFLNYTILTNTITAKNPQGQNFNNVGLLDYRNSFYIDNNDGRILIKSKLQYELVSEMDFAVQVQDTAAEIGQQTSTASVNIRILGSQDATPYFVAPWTEQDPTYYFNIPEESPASLITTLVAFDPVGKLPITNFQEAAGVDQGDYFSVDPSTGSLRVKKRLDYETLRSRVLPVEVNAISESGKTSFARIRIQIQDINDNNPTFDATDYTFDVIENRKYPTTLGRVAARDVDSGPFGEIEYSLSGQKSENFRILRSGEVIVAKDGSLDRETKVKYDLTVTATDNLGGSSQRQGSSQLTINILDENDSVPKFSRSRYTFLTVESAARDTVIGQIQATDSDIGLNSLIIYTMSCADSETSQLFFLNPNTGEIRIYQALTGRMRDYRCDVTASDQGQPKQINTTSLLIQVSSGSNNGIPSFLWPPAGYVAKNVFENRDPPQVVGDRNVSADSVAGSVTYSFKGSSGNIDSSKFAIDPITGQVTTKVKLDREEQDFYELLIYAQVAGNLNLTSGAVLRVQVQDENDNQPSFEPPCDPDISNNPPFKIYIPEDTHTETRVKVISACDRDDPATVRTKYELVSRQSTPEVNPMCEQADTSSFGLVPIDRTRVAIVVWKALDHEDPRGTKHLLCIKTSDMSDAEPVGRRKRQAIYNSINYTVAYVEVNIVDVNDNGPIFPDKTVREAIPEFPTQNYLVGQMSAIDRDSAPLNRVRYSILSTKFISIDKSTRDINIAFEIDPESGDVITKLIRYTQFLGGTFTLNIRAEDALNRAFNDTMTLQVTVVQVGQRLKVTWPIESGKTADSTVMDAVTLDLNNAILKQNGWKLFVDELRYHKDNSGREDYSKLDACFIVVDSNGRTPDTNVVTQQIRTGVTDKQKYDFGLCDVETSRGLGGASTYWWVLVALAIAIFVGTLILIIIFLILSAKYKQKTKSATTSMVKQ